ncbi:MAG: glycosyltransferase family 39 protein [Chloroflexi bacterium]|nr:glycosyltransferase family 39 protein [Chloroflexota bacterium]MDA1146309.1 glycosyltransferase family 39 protein [Chloroflexota bacterium]
MGESWHNFLYAAYDPAGTINVDKPPVALWVQVISTKLFGFSGTAIIAPIAIAGTIAVPLVFGAARRSYTAVGGSRAAVAAGLLAAAVLAVFPESVGTARDSTMDAMLMMGLVAAAWLLVDAVEGKRPWRIVAWAALMGVLFNVKFFEGFIVMPAALLYIIWGFRKEWRTLVRPLAAAALVGAVVSFSWIAVVDLTPKDSRPIVMNDKSNSELGLALRYNGLERVLPGDITVFTPLPGQTGGGNAGQAFGVGDRGPFRLIRQDNAGLVGFGVCLALGGLALVALRRRDWILDGPGLFWGAWLLTGVAFFSASNRAAAHYNEAYAPAIAVLAGVGLVEVWRARGRLASIRRDWQVLVGPAILGLLLLYGVRVYQFITPIRVPAFATIGVGLIAVGVIILATRLPIPARVQRVAYGIAIAAPIAAMLITSAWITLEAPPSGQITRPNPLQFARGVAAPDIEPGVPAEALLAHGADVLPDARYRFAISGINDAGEAIAYTGASVLPVWNNYQRVPVLEDGELTALIRGGDVPYLLIGRQLARTGILKDIEAIAAAECTPATIEGVDSVRWAAWDCVPGAQARTLTR